MAAPAPFATLTPLGDLFARDPERLERYALEVAGLYFDWTKTHIDEAIVERGLERLRSVGFESLRDQLFAGEIVNSTEGRPATHLAERGSGAEPVVGESAARRLRTRALVDAVEAGVFGEIASILHVGIGGSANGPELVVDALGRRERAYATRFVANIDGAAFDEAVRDLDPATTLVVAASKTFTTLEMRANLDAAIEWLRGGDVEDPYGRVIAITAAPEAAVEAGIDETRILSIGDGVGGRYSVWSAVGFTAALALGWPVFEELLDGAALMDDHFLTAEPARNAPLIAAIADRLYAEEAGCQSRAAFAYDERLRLLLPYLQQLEMESNGKSVTAEGSPVTEPTAPITWGGVGTVSQHAVFQLLHQGTIPVPVEFVAVRDGDDDQDPERHALLLLNAFAQAAALLSGNDGGGDPARAGTGGRPSATILLDRLEARALGALLAFYEHRTFANAAMMGINPFDQFGVELGKSVAAGLADGELAEVDPSTKALIEKAGL